MLQFRSLRRQNKNLIICTLFPSLFRIGQWVKTIKSYSEKGGTIMSDETLTCKDCGAEFVFTVGEQEFYAEKGFENKPVRCPACRKARKQARFNNN